MTKKNVMITLDEEIHRRAKELQLNISGECEKVLRDKVFNKIHQEEETKKCHKCGKSSEEAGELIWLCPDECWCCKDCINREVQKIIIGVVPT